MLTVEERIAALEARTEALEARAGVAAPRSEPVRLTLPPRVSDGPPRRATVARSRPTTSSAPPSPRPAPSARPGAEAAAPSARPAAEAAAPSRRPAAALEDALGGRLLAWVGGAAVALGVVFLLAIAVSRGWIGEVERTLLAGVLSGALLAGGVWAHGRRGRTDASLAAVGAGIAGLFATAMVAGSLYHLVPAIVAVVAAVAVGAVATALAVRWAAPAIAALGVVGALISPVLLGAVGPVAPIALLFVVTASAAAVLLWQRWRFLTFGAFVLATPQWVAYLATADPSIPVALAVLTAFGIVTAAAAAGFEVRSRAPGLRAESVLLLAVNALLLAAVGVDILGGLAPAWLVALALAHIAVGLAARRTTRISPELALVGLTLGVVLADVAAARLLDGLPLVIGWAAGGALFAALARRARTELDQRALLAGLGGHLLLALAHALLDVPPHAITDGTANLAGQVALVVVAAGAMISGRLAQAGRTRLRIGLDALALAILAYESAVTLAGVALTVAFAAEAVTLALLARRHTDDPVAVTGAVVFAGLASLQAIAVLAPPDALVYGLADPVGTAAALAAATVAVAVSAVALPRYAAAVRGIAAVLVLYLASVELVTPFQPGPDAIGFGELGVGQQGQALLSALWALAGVGTLIAGLLRDRPALRQGALALLAVTVTKVFLYDLASLTSLYRVASFIALGLLLLAGAFAWQRIRPRPLPDLRSVPDALR